MGINDDSTVDAQSISIDSLDLLLQSADQLMQALPRSQTHLMTAVKTGLLRNVAQLNNKVQSFKTPSFSATQMRRTETRSGSTLAELKVVSDTHTDHFATVTIPEASAFKQLSDVTVQAVLFEDKLTDFAGYKPLVVDVTMYRGRNNAGNTQITPLDVNSLDQEIKIQFPAVPERTLACAFFNDFSGDWQALECDNEEKTDTHVTCCTNHLTRFALVPAEYLELVNNVVK